MGRFLADRNDAFRHPKEKISTFHTSRCLHKTFGSVVPYRWSASKRPEPCFKGANGCGGSRRSGPLFRQSNTMNRLGYYSYPRLYCPPASARCLASTGKEGNPWDGHGADLALVPASPSIEATAAQQKHDDDDDEKSCHIHDGVSFGRMSGYLISPAAGRTWLLVTARAAPLFL